jgi:glutamine synthetase
LSEEELQRRKIGFLPLTLREAVECLAGDDVIKEALGVEYASYYIRVKTEEWNQYHQSVSHWELDRYLPIY